MSTQFGIDHLSLLDAAPPEFVRLAAGAGFSSVGLRVRPIDQQEQRWPMDIGSPMLNETLKLLKDTGLTVGQVESVFLDEHLDVESLHRDMEIGAALKAPFLLVVGMDSDLDRLSDRFARIDELAGQYGLKGMIEPMSYRPVRTVQIALDVVSRSATGGIVTDALHFFRAGNVPVDLDVIPRERLHMAQLCDAGADPALVPRDIKAGRGQNEDVSDLQWEARVGRLFPGDGTLDLATYVEHLPADLPISLEAPDQKLLSEVGSEEFFSRAAASMRKELDGRIP